MKRMLVAAISVALAVQAAPAMAQGVGGYDGQQFVDAVRKQDNDKAISLLEGRPNVVNSKNGKGDTALLVAIANRDETWTGYLLRLGADPNGAGRDGETPLIAASRLGFLQAAEWLLGMGAKVNGDNRMGETPLIVAVQNRQLPTVKLLLQNGANPDKTDGAQGYSARDYAKRDTPSADIHRLIESTKPKAATTMGPTR
mgnify:CR=1 FL=1